MKKRVMFLIVMIIITCSTVFISAASDPAVTVVSPKDTIYGENLFISVKTTAPRTIRVAVFEEKQKTGDNLVSLNPLSVIKKEPNPKNINSVPVMSPEEFTGTTNLQFYNKHIKLESPGLYRIYIETLNDLGDVSFSSTTKVVVMPKNSANSSKPIFEPQQLGAFQWVQNLFKSIFGS